MPKTSWTKPEKGWISGEGPKRIRKKRPANIPYGIHYTPAQCPNPKCHSLDLNGYATRAKTRYYKCRECGVNFKAVVEYQFEIKNSGQG